MDEQALFEEPLLTEAVPGYIVLIPSDVGYHSKKFVKVSGVCFNKSLGDCCNSWRRRAKPGDLATLKGRNQAIISSEILWRPWARRSVCSVQVLLNTN